MPVTLADRVLRIRWVVLSAVVSVSILLGPPVWSAIRPATVSFAGPELTGVRTPMGEITVDWGRMIADFDDLIVRLWKDDGEVVVLAEARTFGGNDRFIANDFAMVCEFDGVTRHYLFGAVGWRRGTYPRPPDDLLAYYGPAATGGRLAGGLYLIVLEPRPIGDDEGLELRRTDSLSVRTKTVFADVLAYGRRHPSGCVVA